MKTSVIRPDPRTVDALVRAVTRYVSCVARWISAHWLLLANLAMGLYAGLPLLAPALMQIGWEWPANLIYKIFSPLCHQLPERSFFLFGRQLAYSLDELSQLLAGSLVPLRYTGNVGIGFKVAICQRDIAQYLTMFLFGLAFVRLRRTLKPLHWKLFLALAAPMAIDGTGQLVRLWESTRWSRVFTGSLFGLACVWFTYPYLERGMKEVHQEMDKALAVWGS